MNGLTPHWTKFAASNVARRAGESTAVIRSVQRPGVSPKISFSFSCASTRPCPAAISASAAIRSMTCARYRSGGSPGGMKNENTRTIVVPSSQAAAATRRIRSSSGASGASTGIFPMGEPIAETATPASASMARNAVSCGPVRSARYTSVSGPVPVVAVMVSQRPSAVTATP